MTFSTCDATPAKQGEHTYMYLSFQSFIGNLMSIPVISIAHCCYTIIAYEYSKLNFYNKNITHVALQRASSKLDQISKSKSVWSHSIIVRFVIVVDLAHSFFLSRFAAKKTTLKFLLWIASAVLFILCNTRSLFSSSGIMCMLLSRIVRKVV